jgi:hypothetical protein
VKKRFNWLKKHHEGFHPFKAVKETLWKGPYEAHFSFFIAPPPKEYDIKYEVA